MCEDVVRCLWVESTVDHRGFSSGPFPLPHPQRTWYGEPATRRATHHTSYEGQPVLLLRKGSLTGYECGWDVYASRAPYLHSDGATDEAPTSTTGRTSMILRHSQAQLIQSPVGAGE